MGRLNMNKYDNKIVNDYINGNDIDDFNIDDLENDSMFMKKVIVASNDKNFYRLCSDRVKKDYNFIKFVIYKFKEDIEFISKVADEFLDCNDDLLFRNELLIIMCDLINKDSEYYIKYDIFLDASYQRERLSIELVKADLEDEFVINEIGFGFLVILNSFRESGIVCNYYAKRFITDIFSEYDIDLEVFLHKKFQSFSSLENIGINNYIINLISIYDVNLAEYLKVHIELLNDVRNEVEKIGNNWCHYNQTQKKNRYENILETVHNYMENEGKDCLYDETELLYFIARELGIDKEVFEYDTLPQDCYDDLMCDLNFLIDKDEMNFNELKHYKNVKKLIIKILSDDSSVEFEQYDKDFGQEDGQVIEFAKLKK